ncbi:MAG: hypothetical protein ACFFEF_03905 [Candidatus Thorarchaeota archaeon]
MNVDPFGYRRGSGQEARELTVLRAVLNASHSLAGTVSFRDIYELLQKEEDFKASKAWVHRILKTLLDQGLIRLEVPSAIRKRYYANIETVTAGLERKKQEMKNSLDSKVRELQKKIDEIEEISCSKAAEDLVEEVIGESSAISSRFISGMKELETALTEFIHEPANPGDIIRSTLGWAGPFLSSGPETRMRKYFESAKRGVDVRWLVDMHILGSPRFSESVDPQSVILILSEWQKLVAQGFKFDVRIYAGGMAYNQTCLNDKYMVLIITEEPVTATFVTRDFNKDLVDDAISSFDKNWEGGVPLLGSSMEEYERIGISRTSPFVGMMSKIAEILKGQGEH